MELIHPRHQGMVLGLQQAVFALGGAMGPAAAGAPLGVTGSSVPAITGTLPPSLSATPVDA